MAERVASRRFKADRKAFYADGKRLDSIGDPAADCWICKGKIDYDAQPGTTDESHELDHYYAVSTHPELQAEPSNFRHSHRRCNRTRSNNAPSVGLGEQVPDWW